MEEEGIGKVLIKATELRYKIINCIETSTIDNKNNERRGENDDDDDDDEEALAAETLISIRDALQTLETQLSSLQALQQQQSYEKETALSEIDSCRKMLLAKLEDCKAIRDLEVINEALAFASESVRPNDDDGFDYDDLLLPPYPICPPRSLFAGNGFPFHESNGVLVNKSRRNAMRESGRSSWKGWRPFLSVTTKMVVTLVGVISVLTLAGFEPKLLRNRNIITPNKLLGLFVQRENAGVSSETMCPPGKVMVVENGETRCLVKERVVIPFKSVVSTPDVSYGCG